MQLRLNLAAALWLCLCLPLCFYMKRIFVSLRLKRPWAQEFPLKRVKVVQAGNKLTNFFQQVEKKKEYAYVSLSFHNFKYTLSRKTSQMDQQSRAPF